MSSEAQVKVIGNFGELTKGLNSLLGLSQKASSEVASLGKVFSYIESQAGKFSAKTVSALKSVAKQAREISLNGPLNAKDYERALTRIDRSAGLAAEDKAAAKELIRSTQQKALRSLITSTAKGANDAIASLLHTMEAEKFDVAIDKSGNISFSRVLDNAKKTVRNLTSSIETAAKNSVDFITKDTLAQIQKWGASEFGSRWTESTTDPKNPLSIGKGVISASQEIEELVRDINYKIAGRITRGLQQTVNETIASGKRVTSEITTKLEQGFKHLEQGARDTLTGKGLELRLAEINKLREELNTKLTNYTKGLDETERLDKLKARVQSLITSIGDKGFGAVNTSELRGVYKEHADLGMKFKGLFEELQRKINDAYKAQADEVVNNILLRGKAGYDKGFLEAARASGASDVAISEINSRMWRALLAYRRNQQAAIRLQLEADRRSLEDALRDAGQKAQLGISPSNKLETLVNNFKAQGKDVSTYLQALEDARLVAIEARLRQDLAQTGKLAAGIEQAYRAEIARNNLKPTDGNLQALLQQLATRKQQEVQTAIDVFNERFAEALFRIKQDLISGKPVNLAGFEAKWSREAASVNAVLDKQRIGDVVMDAVFERNRRELKAAEDALIRQQDQLIAKVRNAISNAGYKGSSISVSTALPLAGELQTAIRNAKGQTANLHAALGSLRGELFRGLQGEIAQLKRDALSAGSAIKAADVTATQSKINLASGALFTGQIDALTRLLNNTVKKVDEAVRQAGIDAVRQSLSASANNLELTSKQIAEQLRAARTEFSYLAVSRAERLNFSEYTSGTARIAAAVKKEANLANNDLRKQALSVIRSLNTSAEMSAKVIADARRQFVSAGGNYNAFEQQGVAAVSEHLGTVVRKMMADGREFTREEVNYFNNLYQAVSTDALVLRHARQLVIGEANQVNANAAAALRSKVEAEIRKVFAEADQLNRVISDHIYKGLESKAFAANIDFKTTFNTEIVRQEEIRAKASLRQRAEGIIKPYEQMLQELSTMRNATPITSAHGTAMRLQYEAKINGEKFIASVLSGLQMALAEISLLNASGAIDTATADSRATALKNQADVIIRDAIKVVANAIHKDLNAIARQFKAVSSGNDLRGISDLSRQLEAAREKIQSNSLGGTKVAKRVDDLAKHLDRLETAVSERIAKNDTLKRAEQMLRSGARSLGGSAALRVQLREIKSAYEEMARSVEQYDRALAERIRAQSRALRQQALNQYQSRQNTGSGGGQGGQQMINGMPAGIYNNYLRQLPMQITDIVVGLSTGQRPLYVLLQQGGQLKDMFGSIGAAVKEVVKYIGNLITPTNLFIGALGGAAVAIGALVRKAANLREEMLQTNVVLGGAAGRTFDFDTIREYGIELSRMYGIMEKDGRKAAMSLAQNARLPERFIKPIIDNVRDLQAFLGKGFDASGLQETVDLLSKAFSMDARGSLHGLAEFFNSIGGWDKETASLIENLFKVAENTKDVEERNDALAKMFDILKDRAKGAADAGLTPFQQETREARAALIQAWETLSDDSAWVSFANGCASAGAALLNFATDALHWIGSVMNKLNDFGKSLGSIKLDGLAGQVYGLSEALPQPARINRPSLSFTQDAAEAGKRAGSAFTIAYNERTKVFEFETVPQSRYNASNFGFQMGSLAGRAASKGFSKTFTEPVGFDFRKTPKEEGVTLNLRTGGGGGGRKGGGGGRSRSSPTDKDLEAAKRYLETLQQEYDQVSKLNRSQRLDYDLKTGKVKMEGQMLELARQYAKEIDERAMREAEITRQQQLRTLEMEKEIALENRRLEMQYEVAKLLGSDRSADYFKGFVDFEKELERTLKKLRKEQDKAVLDAQLALKPEAEIQRIRNYYAEQMRIEREYIEESIKLYKQRQAEIDRLSTLWHVGYRKGVEQVADWIFNISSEVASAVDNWASSMADALSTFVRTGKLSFSDLADSILNDIARIASRQFVSALFGGFQYGWTAIPNAGQSKTAELFKMGAKANTVQKVFVTNKGFGSFTEAASTLGGLGESIKGGGFTLGGGSNFGLGSDPWGLSGTADRVVTEIGREVSPAIKEGASGMFSGLFSKIGSIFSGIGDTISSLFRGFNFSSFGGGGAGGGFWSSLFNGIGGFFSSIFGSLFAKGGYTGPGGKYTPAGIVHAGEYVINAASTRKLGVNFLNQLNGYASGGYVSQRPSIVSSSFAKDAAPMEVNIYNNSDGQVRTQRNSSGGLDIIIEQAVNAVAGNIAAGGNVAAVLQRTYALNRGAGTQRSGF